MDREKFANLAWSVHGVKRWDKAGDLRYCVRGGEPIPAMPDLEYILAAQFADATAATLAIYPIGYYTGSLCSIRQVTRIPIKPPAWTPDEASHLARSEDGLAYFYPVDVYESNISSTAGLLRVFQRCQEVDGFGVSGGRRDQCYSILLVDIAIFWSLFLILFNFPLLAPIRHDLFLVLGPWHTYQHAHRLIWQEFRQTFLAPAFFSVCPGKVLFFAPKLQESSTFLSWLRLAYPDFRDELLQAVATSRNQYRDTMLSYAQHIKERKESMPAVTRARYVHLCNLLYLFEFVVPVVHDYGAALKLGKWNDFEGAFLRILKFYISSKSKGTNQQWLDVSIGAVIYKRALYVWYHMLSYAREHELPLWDLFSRSPTFFSEESGEISLSVLAQSLPSNHSGDIKATRYKWQETRMRADGVQSLQENCHLRNPKKHFRHIGLLYLFRLRAC